MSKFIRCPQCGYSFKESGWSKAGRYGVYTAEAAIKIGAQVAVAFFTRGKSSLVSNMAGKAAEGVTGDCTKYTWGDLCCPKCNKNLGNP